MRGWMESWAFWAGAVSGLAGAASAVAGAVASLRRTPGRAGSNDRLIEGTVAAVVNLVSPATERDCVQYSERVEATVPLSDIDNLDETEGQETLEELVPEKIVDRAVGVFLVESEAGKALVWPEVGDVRYAEGWTTKERDDGTRSVSERILVAGAKVIVSGTPGTFGNMMSHMAEEAEDLPDGLLSALQNRADLGGLPCYWPRGGDFSVEEEGAVLDEGDEPAGLGLHFMFAAAAFLLSGVLLFCAYRRIL